MSTGSAQMRTTIRKRKKGDTVKEFIPYQFSNLSSIVEDLRIEMSLKIPEVFVTYEHTPIYLPNGKMVIGKYVLWVPLDELTIYKKWQADQQHLKHLQRTQPGLTLDSLTLDETERSQRPTPRPLTHTSPKKQKQQSPVWLTMPSVLRDGNGKEYQWPTPPEPEPAPAPIVPDIPEPIVPMPVQQPRTPMATFATNHKGIRRYDTARLHGYRASVTWKKIDHTKQFSDASYGDRLSALAAAIEWRNATERKIGKPRTEHMITATVRSNTGYQGIHESCKRGKYLFFEVYWIDCDGKTGSKAISINKYGRKVALRMAKKLRLEKARERIRSKEGKRF